MGKQTYLLILLPALLVSTTVNCYPVPNANINLKREFNTTVQKVLNTIKSQCGAKKMNWNEYCRNGSLVKCPKWGQKFPEGFYGQHCPLAYFNQEIQQWEKDTFDSPEYIEKQLKVTLETFPPVQCGNDGDSCPRDKQLCYRSTDPRGMCMDAEEFCKDEPPSHLCQQEAGIYILKKELLKTLERMKKSNSKKESSVDATSTEVNMKRKFNKGFQKILDSFKSKCNDMDMNWNEYCLNGFRLKCPDRGREPKGNFYGQHCSLIYLAREIEEWQEDTYGSSELIKKRLMTTLEMLPREECGNEGESCARDTELCYRGVDEAGICLKADEICLSNPNSVVCVMEAGSFVVKMELLKFIENLKTKYPNPEPATFAVADLNGTDTINMILKEKFKTALLTALNSINSTCGNLNMNWDEYCQHGSLKKCPDRGQMPPSFYTKHCSLAYLKKMIERWENGVYYSAENIEIQLSTTLNKLPPISCGNEGKSCVQPNEFCLRDAESRGICVTAAEYCSENANSRLCQNQAGMFIVKIQLEKTIENLKNEKIKHVEKSENKKSSYFIIIICGTVTIFVSVFDTFNKKKLRSH